MWRLCWGCEKGFGKNGRFVSVLAIDLLVSGTLLIVLSFSLNTHKIEWTKHFRLDLLSFQS